MIVQLKIVPWDKVFEFDIDKESKRFSKNDFKIGDEMIIKTESHLDLAKIIGFINKQDQKEEKDKTIEEVTIIRKANNEDRKKIGEKEKRREEFLGKAIAIAEKLKVSAKFVDFHLSLDGGKIVFAFVAPDRVDFRDLVKELSQEFHRSIRLHQINPREEMKIFSGVGCCGRPVCCLSFLKNLGGVKTNFIEDQQLGYRGIDRLSGPCGRLKCCLAYENNFYLEQKKKMPALGEKARINGKEGVVVGWHLLKNSIDLKTDKDTILEVSIEDTTN